MNAPGGGIGRALDECEVFRTMEDSAALPPPPLVQQPAGAALPTPTQSSSEPSAAPSSLLDELDRVLADEQMMTSPGELQADPPSAKPPVPAAAEPASATPASSLADILTDAIEAGAHTIHFDITNSGMVATARMGGERRILGELAAGALEAQLRRAAGIRPDQPMPSAVTCGVETPTGLSNIEFDILAWSGGIRYVGRVLHRRSFDGLDALGLEPHVAKELRTALSRPHGGMIVLGVPIAEGARSTLLALGAEAAVQGKLIVSLIGPAPERENWSWISLRSSQSPSSREDAVDDAMRHDPDVLLIGRVHNKHGTVRAFRAAADGRHVILAVSARGAVDAVSALRHLDVDPVELAAARPVLVGQRLVRALCPSCREPVGSDELSMSFGGFPESEVAAASFYRATGCDRCSSGYLGNVLISEVLSPPEAAALAIREGLTGSALDQRVPGLRMRDSAFRALARGRTTVEALPMPMA
ncbi:MAG: Flp pilus assembly complex ATPase component TadA [Planctomycetes bacterium]|nr:Flp pilus assembly complex ATPase component TadA [Planctomycetota bacterium]